MENVLSASPSTYRYILFSSHFDIWLMKKLLEFNLYIFQQKEPEDKSVREFCANHCTTSCFNVQFLSEHFSWFLFCCFFFSIPSFANFSSFLGFFLCKLFPCSALGLAIPSRPLSTLSDRQVTMV